MIIEVYTKSDMATIVWVPEVEGSWASIKKTTPAFAATSIKPAIAGPTARAMLNSALFKAMAAMSCDRGNSSGTIACQAAPFIAAPKY